MNIVYIILSILLILLVGRIIHRRKHVKNKVIQVIDNNCTRCRSCLLKCSHHVLDMVNDENGTRIEVKYPDKCTGCGDCINACNFQALELVDRVSKN